MRYIFDTETDGLLPELTTIHCIALYDLDTDELHSFADQPGHRPISEGLRLLAEAKLLVGHNSVRFDIPAIKKVFPQWETKAVIRDTLICARMLWPHILELDTAKRSKQPDYLPGNLMGAHSLKAWGYRMKYPKDEYTGGWKAWSQSMHDYMCRDVRVTVRLWQRITEKNCPELPFEIEHRFAEIIFLQEQRGFAFDVDAAQRLTSKLIARKCELEAELQRAFPAWYVGELREPKRNLNRKRPDWGVPESYTAGCPFSKLELVTFNPGSRDRKSVV